MKRALFVAAVGVAAVAWWLLSSQEEGTESGLSPSGSSVATSVPPTVSNPSAVSTPASGPGVPGPPRPGLGRGKPAAPAIPWDKVPPAARPEAVLPLGPKLGAWFAEHPIEGVELRPMDCSTAPCILPVTFPPGRFQQDGPLGALVAEANALDSDLFARVAPVLVDGHPAAGLVFLPSKDPVAAEGLLRSAMGRRTGPPPAAEEEETQDEGPPLSAPPAGPVGRQTR